MAKISVLYGTLDSFGAAESIWSAYSAQPGLNALVSYGQLGAVTTAWNEGRITDLRAYSNTIMPMFNVLTQTYAGVLTLSKITADIASPNREFQVNDVASLIGNGLSGAAAIRIMATGGQAGGAGGIAIGGALAGAVALGSSDSARLIYSWLYNNVVEQIFKTYYQNNPSSVYPGLWISPTMTLASPTEINRVFGGRIALLCWNPNNNSFWLSSTPIYFNHQYFGGGSAPGIPFLPAFTPEPIGYAWAGPVTQVWPSPNPMPASDDYECCVSGQDAYVVVR